MGTRADSDRTDLPVWAFVAPTREDGCRLWTGTLEGGRPRYRGGSARIRFFREAGQPEGGRPPLVYTLCGRQDCVEPSHLTSDRRASVQARRERGEPTLESQKYAAFGYSR